LEVFVREIACALEVQLTPGDDRAGTPGLTEGLSAVVVLLFGDVRGEEGLVPADKRVLNEAAAAVGNFLRDFRAGQELLLVPQGKGPRELV
jgi:hypothetical protein